MTDVRIDLVINEKLSTVYKFEISFDQYYQPLFFNLVFFFVLSLLSSNIKRNTIYGSRNKDGNRISTYYLCRCDSIS